jgi:hypothetical protein
MKPLIAFHKNNLLLIILFTIIIFSCINNSNNKKLKSKHKSHSKLRHKQTPQGHQLLNHFNAHRFNNLYGPKEPQEYQYVQSNLLQMVPTLNYSRIFDAENKYNRYKVTPESASHAMNPTPYKSGSYRNIAPDYHHEINPAIVGPQLEVSGDIEYPVNIRTPTFLGKNKEYINVLAHDKVNGDVFEDKTLVESPKYGYQNRVVNLSRPFSHHYDLRTGERISTSREKHLFGIDNAPEWKRKEEVVEDECKDKKDEEVSYAKNKYTK